MSAKKKPIDPAPVKKSAIKDAAVEPTSGTQALPNEADAESSQPESESNKEIPDASHSLPPRLKLVELATQLVAAQLTASASYQAAVDVATEQREMLVECLEILAGIWKPATGTEQGAATSQKQEPSIDQEQESATAPEQDLSNDQEQDLSNDQEQDLSNDQEQESAAYQVVAKIIRERLRYSGVRIRKPPELSPLSGPELDQLFASAMYRAQKLLIAPEQDRRIVWAEQLFEPEDILSENQIFETFRKYNWPNLKSRPSVVELMTDVDNWFYEHYGYLGRVDGDENKKREATQVRGETDLLVQVLDLFDERAKEGFNHYRRDYKAVADAIKGFLRARDTRILDTLSGAFWNSRAQNLIFMIFNQSAPQPRGGETNANSQPSEKRIASRKYWAWGIFRYLRLYAGESGDETGAAINSRIRTRVLKLNPDLVVNVRPVAPPEFEFGPIGDDMDYLLDALESPEHEGMELPDTPFNATYGETEDFTDENLPL
jgi:hypothetical protein